MTGRSYRFADASRPGLVLGLAGRQLTPLIAGVLWLALTLQLGVPILGIAGPVLGVTVAFGRWRGTPLAEVLLPTIRLHVTRSTRRTPWAATPLLATSTSESRALPEVLAGLELLDVPHRGRTGSNGRVAVVHDRRAGILSVCIRVRGHQFALAAPDTQDQLLGRWGAALSPLARERSPIVRCTWQEWAHPLSDRAHHDFLTSIYTDTRPDPHPDPTFDDYLALLDQQSPRTITHQTLLTLTIDQRRTRRRHGISPVAAAIDALLDELDQLANRLETAELTVETILTPAELATAIRVRSDPTTARQLDTLHQAHRNHEQHESLATATGRIPIEWAPSTVDTTWSSVHVDGTWHRSYRIATWPPLPVGAEWLGPLITSTDATRTLTVTLEPVPMSRAARAADREVMGREADADLKTRKGFRVSARERKRLADVEARERELSEGHAEFRFVGLVDVTAPTLDDLDDACATVEQAAAQSLVDLRPLDARHDLGWVAALPLGRNVPSRISR